MMQIHILKSKIHGVKVTQAELHYKGSITIDEDLLDAADISEYEKVLVVNKSNGERFETYTLKGERGSGIICLNGPSARLAQVGDMVIVISFCIINQTQANVHVPVVIFPNEKNFLE